MDYYRMLSVRRVQDYNELQQLRIYYINNDFYLTRYIGKSVTSFFKVFCSSGRVAERATINIYPGYIPALYDTGIMLGDFEELSPKVRVVLRKIIRGDIYID